MTSRSPMPFCRIDAILATGTLRAFGVAPPPYCGRFCLALAVAHGREKGWLWKCPSVDERS
jgi:hypothetical protein